MHLLVSYRWKSSIHNKVLTERTMEKISYLLIDMPVYRTTLLPFGRHLHEDGKSKLLVIGQFHQRIFIYLYHHRNWLFIKEKKSKLPGYSRKEPPDCSVRDRSRSHTHVAAEPRLLFLGTENTFQTKTRSRKLYPGMIHNVCAHGVIQPFTARCKFRTIKAP